MSELRLLIDFDATKLILWQSGMQRLHYTPCEKKLAVTSSKKQAASTRHPSFFEMTEEQLNAIM